jgi:hypothetical protein
VGREEFAAKSHWQITQKDLPPFKEQVRMILQDMGETH